MADTVKVTLIKSTIGAVPKNKKTIEALGLTKVGKTVELPNNAATNETGKNNVAIAPNFFINKFSSSEYLFTDSEIFARYVSC